MNRRGFLTGLLAAPALIAASRLEFGVPKLILPPEPVWQVSIPGLPTNIEWSVDGGRTWEFATRHASGSYYLRALPPDRTITVLWRDA